LIVVREIVADGRFWLPDTSESGASIPALPEQAEETLHLKVESKLRKGQPRQYDRIRVVWFCPKA
jgi:hypothetical protein